MAESADRGGSMTLPDPLERLSVGGGALYVFAGAAGYLFGLLVAYVGNAFGWDADYEASGGELAALGDDGAGGDDGTLADLRAVQDGRAHADETVVFDLAPMHDGVVAHDASLTDERRVAWVRMQDAPVLDVGPGPDADRLRIAAQHGPVPDARFFLQVDVPDDVGSRRDPGGLRDPGESVAVGKHVSLVVQIQRGALTLYSRYTSPNFRSR